MTFTSVHSYKHTTCSCTQVHTNRHVGLCAETEARASTAAMGSSDPSFSSGSVNLLFYRNPPVLSEMLLSRVLLCLLVLYLYPHTCTARVPKFQPSPITSCWDHLSLSRLVTLISIYYPLVLLCSLCVVDAFSVDCSWRQAPTTLERLHSVFTRDSLAKDWPWRPYPTSRSSAATLQN